MKGRVREKGRRSGARKKNSFLNGRPFDGIWDESQPASDSRGRCAKVHGEEGEQRKGSRYAAEILRGHVHRKKAMGVNPH